jgi:hypothetical protein
VAGGVGGVAERLGAPVGGQGGGRDVVSGGRVRPSGGARAGRVGAGEAARCFDGLGGHDGPVGQHPLAVAAVSGRHQDGDPCDADRGQHHELRTLDDLVPLPHHREPSPWSSPHPAVPSTTRVVGYNAGWPRGVTVRPL